MKKKPEEKSCQCSSLTRRGFLATVGAGTMALATSGKIVIPAKGEEIKAPVDTASIRLTINGRSQPLLVEPRWSLLYVLREGLGLTGTKTGCERGECGSCTVLIDDIPRYSCLTLAVEAEGRKITTVEGLLQGEKLGPVQQAFVEKDALQCGYCTSGQIMAVEGLLRANPQPSLKEIQRGVSGNLCRCGAYVNIFKAAELAVEKKRSI